MSKYLLIALFSFAATAQTLPFTLDCKVTGTKSELNADDLKDEGFDYLKTILNAKTGVIQVDGEYTVLRLANDKGEPVEFIESKYDSSTAKTTITKANYVTMKQYVSQGYKRRGEVAYYNDDASPVDDSFGAHFDLVFKKTDLERGTGSMDVRIWTAALSEPDDDTGAQSLLWSSNVFMSCSVK